MLVDGDTQKSQVDLDGARTMLIYRNKPVSTTVDISTVVSRETPVIA